MTRVEAGGQPSPIGQHPHWPARICLLGTGLIGASIGAAVKARRMKSEIVGWSPFDAREALALHHIDRVASSVEDAVRDADLVVLAAPVGVNAQLIAGIAPHLGDDALLTDVSSVKAPVVDSARQHLGPRLAQFVASHPIAGSQFSGPGAATAHLYDGCICVLSPMPENDEHAVRRLEHWWSALGARVERMPAEQHDVLYAALSHWPHAVSFAMARSMRDQAIDARFGGPSLRDMTRIAGSAPDLWADILLSNARAVERAADTMQRELQQIIDALKSRDRARLESLFADGARWRRQAEESFLPPNRRGG